MVAYAQSESTHLEVSGLTYNGSLLNSREWKSQTQKRNTPVQVIRIFKQKANKKVLTTPCTADRQKASQLLQTQKWRRFLPPGEGGRYK